MAMNEQDDGWSVPVSGYELLTVEFSGRLSLTVYGDGGKSCTIALEGQFTLRTADGNDRRLDAEQDWSQLTPVLSLRHAGVAELRASRDGDLDVAFDNGALLQASPDPRYESWEISGPGDLNLVCPPGGGDPRIRG
jgi:Family of unknown function (DUF6188)